jgi:hypothetical protein
MRGRGIEIVIKLLDVLSVIPFSAGKSEEALLQNRIATVPKREREAEPSFPIADPEKPVFSPPVGAAARMVMREIVPAFAVCGVVLADRAPLTLGKVRTPSLPIAKSQRVFLEAASFGVQKGHGCARMARRGHGI